MSSTTWRKSSYTGQEGGTCVELAGLGTDVGVRDSTDPDGPVLRFGRDVLAGLLDWNRVGIRSVASAKGPFSRCRGCGSGRVPPGLGRRLGLVARSIGGR